jgi:uncharacterized protein YodC (DUF2158 family)
MARASFKAGELVQLKSGGPKMVVEQYVSYSDAYECTWFAGTKHNQQKFKVEALQYYDENNE